MRGVPGPVPAAAIDHDYLDAVSAQNLQRQERSRDAFGFVEYRDDDRDHGRNHGRTAA